MRRSLLSVALALTTGCYVLPPIRAGGAVGGAAGQAATRDAVGRVTPHGAGALTEAHVGLTPLTLQQGTSGRKADLSLGWTFDWTHPTHGPSQLDHGFYLEGAWFVRGAVPYPGLRWRLAPTVRGELMVPRPDATRSGESTDDRAGFGASVGLLYELVDEQQGGGLFPGAYGAVLGEIGIGAAVRAGVRNLEDGTVAFAVLSLEFRWPGMIGVAIPLTPSRR